jgi:chromosome partitioning protein
LIQEVEGFKPVWKSQSNLLGIVLTMVDYRSGRMRRTMDALRKRYGPTLFAIEIRTSDSLAEAPAAGKSIFDYKPRSTGALAYALLAEEFLMRDPTVDRIPAAFKKTVADRPR